MKRARKNIETKIALRQKQERKERLGLVRYEKMIYLKDLADEEKTIKSMDDTNR